MQIAKKYLYNFDHRVRKSPLGLFVGLLVVLFAFIWLGSHWRNSNIQVEEEEKLPRQIDVFYGGQMPRVKTTMKVEVASLVTVYAQMSGVVDDIFASPGMNTSAGEVLVDLSSNYVGDNLQANQVEIAEKTYRSKLKNYKLQLDLVEKQRQLVKSSEEKSEETREIIRSSIDKTEEIVDLNRSLLNTINQKIEEENEENVLSGLKQQRLSLLNSLNAAEQSLKNNRLSVDEDGSVVEMDELDNERALSQLDLQERSLALDLEISKLNQSIARINVSLMKPAAPVKARVERIYVNKGDLVQPGSPLLLLSASEDSIVGLVELPKKLAKQFVITEPTRVKLVESWYEIFAEYVSDQPVDGRKFLILYSLSSGTNELSKGSGFVYDFTDGEFLEVEIPVSMDPIYSDLLYVPLEAIYQSDDQAVLYVVEESRAVSRRVELGQVLGRFVEVVNGLESGEVVILDRNVVEGELVVVK